MFLICRYSWSFTPPPSSFQLVMRSLEWSLKVGTMQPPRDFLMSEQTIGCYVTYSTWLIDQWCI